MVILSRNLNPRSRPNRPCHQGEAIEQGGGKAAGEPLKTKNKFCRNKALPEKNADRETKANHHTITQTIKLRRRNMKGVLRATRKIRVGHLKRSSSSSESQAEKNARSAASSKTPRQRKRPPEQRSDRVGGTRDKKQQKQRAKQ